MATPEDGRDRDDTSRTEAGSILAWRREYLYKLGVEWDEAGELAARPDVDPHYIEAVVNRGATLEQALAIAVYGTAVG